MAVKTFLVLYNKQPHPGMVSDAPVVVATGAQATARHHNLGAEPITITGPITDYRAIQITAETAQAAATAARVFLGASVVEGELTVAEVAATEKKDAH